MFSETIQTVPTSPRVKFNTRRTLIFPIIHLGTMELRIALLSTFLLILLVIGLSDGGYTKKKKIIIHIPVKQTHHKHTHTQIKTIHHHHKPTIIKEEKIIKQEIHKPVHHIKEEVEHEHYHHHYKHDHPEIKEEGHHFPEYHHEHKHEHLFD